MRKKIRLLLGLGLMVAAVWLATAWLLMPGLWSITSTRAVVNARIITLHSPIEGTVATSPPPVGKAVSAGCPLFDVENALVDGSRLEELQTEVASLAERVTALKAQDKELERLKKQLSNDAGRYHEASLRRLERQVDEARAVAAAADSFLKQRTYRKQQLSKLFAGKSVSELEMVTGDLALEAAQSKSAQAQACLRRLNEELEAARDSSFAGLSDSRNDVPYSMQRAHEIAIYQHDLAAKTQEHTVRYNQVRKQLRIEQQRLERQSRFHVKAPIDGIVWRRPVDSGSTVTRQTDLLQLLDASDIFVDALVNERYFGAAQPGDEVVIGLIGSHEEVPGVVKEVLGQVMLGEDRSLAAEALHPGAHEIHLIVAFANGSPTVDHFHLYHIGQPAKIRYANGVGLWKRLKDMVSP
ncbi:MAG TPA: HlyD family efflux transporter periplasmic adaptor subunit [Gemmataceae bacterium]|jgi:multidrug resistance efflux pump|nr:HlyD family efflux transporter periplasmic adaptor subunit [Gemmataceae bacterium]